MIIRPQYMNTLKTYRDVPLVKILAGIRRCGKSTILDMLRDDQMCIRDRRWPSLWTRWTGNTFACGGHFIIISLSDGSGFSGADGSV